MDEKELRVRLLPIVKSIYCDVERDTIEKILDNVIADIKVGNVNFSNLKKISLKKGDGKRFVCLFNKKTTEGVLISYVKSCMDYMLNVYYPNRDDVMHRFFNEVRLLRNLRGFLVYKFDFEDYFNSISMEYVYEFFIKERIQYRQHRKIFELVIEKLKYCCAGIPLSNTIAEIIGRAFDDLVQARLKKEGLIYYNRYVDDVILILGKDSSADLCEKVIEETITDIFLRTEKMVAPCCTRLNPNKVQYVRFEEINEGDPPVSIDYLGYSVFFSVDQNQDRRQLKLQYGIEKNKRDKYEKKLEDIVRRASATDNVEVLRHAVKAFCSRVLYIEKRHGVDRWIKQGIISTYGELRNHWAVLHPETKNFLSGVVWQVMDRVYHGAFPYFMPKQSRCNERECANSYNLYYSMERNKALIFVEHSCVGIQKETLLKMCKQLGCGSKYDSYVKLRRKYLEKVGICR